MNVASSLARLLLSAASITCLLTTSVVDMAIAQSAIRFNPPPTGAPGNREPGSSRSTSCISLQHPVNPDGSVSELDSVVALIPDSGFSLTTEAYPTFYIYLPPTESGRVEFRIYSYESSDLIYEVNLYDRTNGSGLAKIELGPELGMLPLEVDTLYQWDVAIVCTDENGISSNIGSYSSGVIQRVEMPADLATQIATATEAELPSIYAEAGLWQNMMDSFVTLIETNSNNETYRSNLDAVLEAVDITEINSDSLFEPVQP